MAESVLGVPAAQVWSVMVPREPFVGPETMAKVRSQVSTSEPERVMETRVSSLVDTVLGSAAGRSLTALTVMETVAAVEVAVAFREVVEAAVAPAVHGSPRRLCRWACPSLVTSRPH